MAGEIFSNQQHEIKLNIDTTGKIGFVNMEKVKGVYEPKKLYCTEAIYEEIIREIVDSFLLNVKIAIL